MQAAASAADNGTSLVDLLKQLPPPKPKRYYSGMLPLAVGCSDVRAVQWVWEQARAACDASDIMTAFTSAIKRGHVAAAQFLHGKLSNVPAAAMRDWTHMCSAVDSGSVATLQFLCDNALPTASTASAANRLFALEALFAAAIIGRYDMCKVIWSVVEKQPYMFPSLKNVVSGALSHGNAVDPEVADQSLLTIVRALLDYVVLNPSNTDRSTDFLDGAVLRAVQHDRLQCLLLVLNAGADVQFRRNEAVHKAHQAGRLATVKLLLDHGAFLG